MKDLLQRARALIAEGEKRYVCIAIVKAASAIGTGRAIWEAEVLEDIIAQAIYPHKNAEDWLRIKHHIHTTPEQMREYRLAWIDHLIKELT